MDKVKEEAVRAAGEWNTHIPAQRRGTAHNCIEVQIDLNQEVHPPTLALYTPEESFLQQLQTRAALYPPGL